MKSAVVGFPRVGRLRELKFASEMYFRREISKENLNDTAKQIKKEHWSLQNESGIDYISSNDFSFYDGVLDTTVLLGAIPKCYQELRLNELDTYFAMARGYQGEQGDVKAFSMKKWFNTNYHYMVPELYEDTRIHLSGSKPFNEYLEAKAYGIETKPVIIGAFTFLKLAKYHDDVTVNDFLSQTIQAYKDILSRFHELGAKWVQFDEPALVTDLTDEDIRLFEIIYSSILESKHRVKVLLQTYFGDIRDCYKNVIKLGFDGIGLDFVEGKKTVSLIQEYGFPKNKILFAGVINGKNIWKCDYDKAISLLNEIKNHTENIVISTSCSLLHVPFTLENETKLVTEVKEHFAFAKEKLLELHELSILIESEAPDSFIEYQNNRKVFTAEKLFIDRNVQRNVAELSEKDFERNMKRTERHTIQKKAFGLPLLPTTTI